MKMGPQQRPMRQMIVMNAISFEPRSRRRRAETPWEAKKRVMVTSLPSLSETQPPNIRPRPLNMGKAIAAVSTMLCERLKACPMGFNWDVTMSPVLAVRKKARYRCHHARVLIMSLGLNSFSTPALMAWDERFDDASWGSQFDGGYRLMKLRMKRVTSITPPMYMKAARKSMDVIIHDIAGFKMAAPKPYPKDVKPFAKPLRSGNHLLAKPTDVA